MTIEHNGSNDHVATYRIEARPVEVGHEQVVEEQVMELESVHADRFTETSGGAKLCDLLVSIA